MAREAATRALIAIRDNEDIESEEYQDLIQVISQYMFRAWPQLAPADIQDVAQETIERLLARRELLAEVPDEGLLGYALRGARNRQVDRWRSRQHEAPLESIGDRTDAVPASDDGVLRMLDQSASLVTVRRLLQVLVEGGDVGAYRALVAWLDLAQQEGRAPTSREVATELGISHTSVGRALIRARRLLSSPDELAEP